MGTQGCLVEELGHTADVGVRASAATLPDLFACVAYAMFGLMATAGPDRRFHYPISITAPDQESLLVDWLSELLYLHEITGAVFDHITIDELSAQSLKAHVAGDLPLQRPGVQIKAVTYHQLAIRQTSDGWMAEVFFDV